VLIAATMLPSLARQALAEQLLSTGHDKPQPPQFSGSSEASTQPVPHATWGATQLTNVEPDPVSSPQPNRPNSRAVRTTRTPTPRTRVSIMAPTCSTAAPLGSGRLAFVSPSNSSNEGWTQAGSR
jgi:hypothetical protein